MISPRQNLTFKQLSIYYEEKKLEPTQQFIESLDLRQSGGEYNYAAYLLDVYIIRDPIFRLTYRKV